MDMSQQRKISKITPNNKRNACGKTNKTVGVALSNVAVVKACCESGK